MVFGTRLTPHQCLNSGNGMCVEEYVRPNSLFKTCECSQQCTSLHWLGSMWCLFYPCFNSLQVETLETGSNSVSCVSMRRVLWKQLWSFSPLDGVFLAADLTVGWYFERFVSNSRLVFRKICTSFGPHFCRKVNKVPSYRFVAFNAARTCFQGQVI